MEALNEAVKKLLPEGLVPSLVTIAVILLATLILMKVINKLFKLLLKKGRVDATQVVFGKRILKGVVYILAICCVLFQFAPMQQFVVSLLAGSGILVVILGFAAQEAMANLVSGMFISIFKPFGLGDRIKLVEKISTVSWRISPSAIRLCERLKITGWSSLIPLRTAQSSKM